MSFFSRPEKSSFTYQNIFGQRINRTVYHDTGKVTDTVTRDRLLGGKVTTTYIVKEGNKKR